MKKLNLDWTLGFSAAAQAQPEEWFPAHVPGAAQYDYARAHNWGDHNYGVNFKDYAWMEDVYWTYRAYLNFTLEGNETAVMVFKGIDYEYDVLVDGTLLYSYEGMFAPAYIDLSKYTGGSHELTVRIHPIPKATDTVDRSQARMSAKPAACYEWDWHPRLASVGIWDEAYLMIQHRCRFIKYDAFRKHCHYSCNSYPLFLPARKHMRGFFSEIIHPYCLQRHIHSSSYFFRINSKIFRAESYIIFYYSGNHLIIRILEYHSYSLSDVPDPRLIRSIHSVYIDFSSCGKHKTIHILC